MTILKNIVLKYFDISAVSDCARKFSRKHFDNCYRFSGRRRLDSTTHIFVENSQASKDERQ